MTQTWMLISGSSKLVPGMEDYVRRVVNRAIQSKHMIVLGDSNYGVDRIAAEEILKWSYPDWSITSIQGEQPRSLTSIATGKQVPSKYRFEDYRERDALLCDMCDEAMWIWDGKSQVPPEAFEYLKAQNKTVHIADFSSGKAVVTSHKRQEEERIIEEVKTQMKMF